MLTSPFNQMADKWNDIIENSKSGDSALIDVNMWLGKATLDAYGVASALSMCRLQANRGFISQRFGTGAFDYDFGALDEKDNQLTKSYMNVMYDHLHWTSAVQDSCHVDDLSCSLAIRHSGFHRGCSFS